MSRTLLLLLLIGLPWAANPAWIPVSAQPKDSYDVARNKLVDEILVPGGINHPRVVQAMRSTPRHEFVERELRDQAYFDMSLPIGSRQTISSPFIVAYMTQSLDPQPTDRVLEIGTGSGFQAAVLSPLVDQVYTIEIVESLGRNAAAVLKRLKYENVFVKVGDGFKGWEEHAPFDKIIVTCSPENVPQPLINQLKEGGMMVVPVGERYQQTLYLMRKENGILNPALLRPTLFVPMTGRAEAERVVKPDPNNPHIVNGDFEEDASQVSFIPGWFYERLVTWQFAPDAPQGRHFVSFQNDLPGRSAHMLQGVPLDGRQIKEIEISAVVRAINIKRGPDKQEFATIAISFYDDTRKEITSQWVDPISGTSAWKKRSKKVRVPAATREAIVRVGLFGATGELNCDDLKLSVNK